MTRLSVGRWRFSTCVARARSFRFAGVEWERLVNGLSVWMGIGGIFVVNAMVWRETVTSKAARMDVSAENRGKVSGSDGMAPGTLWLSDTRDWPPDPLRPPPSIEIWE